MKLQPKRSYVVLSVIITISVIIWLAHAPFVISYLDKVAAREDVKIHAYDKYIAKQSKVLPQYYSNLLNTVNLKKSDSLKFDETLLFKFRKPFSIFIYANKYAIAAYRIDTATKLSLGKDLREKDTTSDRLNGVIYAVDELGSLKCLYNTTLNVKPTTIILKISGDKTNLFIKNDTIAYYYSKVENLSIQYKNDKLQDIYAESHYQNIPTAILFKRKNESLFVFIMTVKRYDGKMNPKLLYNILND